MELEIVPFDVRECAEGAVTLMRTIASDKGLELRAEVEPTVPPGIYGDGSRLRQILLNLLGNAVKFTEEGAVVLTVDARPARTGADEVELHISRARHGHRHPGRPHAPAVRLVQPDRRVDLATLRRHRPRACDLEAPRRADGRNDVGRERRRRAREHVPPDPHRTTGRGRRPPERRGDKGKLDLDPEQADRHPLRILVAEDNIVNQKLALRLLRAMGYEADVAANGLEAIDAVERQPYDIVLMDMQMPEMDGLEATRVIHERLAPEQRPRIVAMTANVTDEDRREADEAGMDGYVTKPIRIPDLVGALLETPSMS